MIQKTVKNIVQNCKKQQNILKINKKQSFKYTNSKFYNNSISKQLKINKLEQLVKFDFNNILQQEIKKIDCKYAQNDYNDLNKALNRQIDNIENSIQGGGINYLTFLLDSSIQLSLKESIISKTLQAIYTIPNLKEELHDPQMIFQFQLNILSLFNSEYKLNTDTLKKLAVKVVDSLYLCKDIQLEEILNNINKKSDQLPDDIKNLYKFTIEKIQNENFKEDRQDKIREYLQLDFEKLKQFNIEVKNFDYENKQITIYMKNTNQTVIFQGIEDYPYNSFSYIEKILQENKNEINLLIADEAPTYDNIGNESISDSKNMEGLYKKITPREELKGEELYQYVTNYFQPQFGEFIPETKQFQQRIGKQTIVNLDLVNIFLRFLENANKSNSTYAQENKIILGDLPLSLQIQYMTMYQTKQQLEDLLNLCNYTILLEKTKFMQQSLKQGCLHCNGEAILQDKLYSKLYPQSYIAILAGDKNYDLNYKWKFFANQVNRGLEQNQEYQKTLVVTGSYNLFKSLKEFIDIKTQENPQNFDFLQVTKDFQEYTKNVEQEFFEKTAILEVLHEVIDSKNIKEYLINNDKFNEFDVSSQNDMINYSNACEKYSQLLSFENLMGNMVSKDATEVKESDMIFKQGEHCETSYLCFGPRYYTEEGVQEFHDSLPQIVYNETDMRNYFQLLKDQTFTVNRFQKKKLEKKILQEQNQATGRKKFKLKKKQ